jgi:hypothetical protein
MKQLPWLLFALILGLLFVLIYVPTQLDITAYKDQPTSTSRSIKYYSAWMDAPIVAYSSTPTDKSGQNLPRAQKYFSETNYQKIRHALISKNYQRVNALILAQLQRAPQDPYAHIIFSLGYNNLWITGAEEGQVDIQLPYRYLVTHQSNFTPLISDRSDAAKAIGNTLGVHRQSDWRIWNGNFILFCLLGTLCILFGSTVTRDHQNHTEYFVHTLPTSTFRYQLSRVLLVIIVFNITVFFAVTLNIAVIALSSDHNLGSFFYPLAFLHKGDTIFTTLWQFYVLWWLLLNLWALFLAGISLLISFWANTTIANIFCLSVITFAKPLSLLDILPKGVQPFLPSNYNDVSGMFYQLRTFYTLPPSKWIAIFIAWIVPIWIAVALIIKIRELPQSNRQ